MTDQENTNAIVFIHQSSGSSAVWDDVVSEKKLNQFHLYCIDIDGNGDRWDKNAIGPDYSLASLSNKILETINKLKLKNYILVGVSIGTNIIGEIADKLSNCKGIVLVGAPIVGGEITPAEVLLPFEYGHVLIDVAPKDSDLDHCISGLTYYQNQKQQEMLKADYLKTDPNYRKQLLNTINEGLWSDEIGNLRDSHQPVMVVYGIYDKICNTRFLENVGLHLWQNKIHLIDNAGHLAHLDQPAFFSKLLVDFATDVFGESQTTSSPNS